MIAQRALEPEHYGGLSAKLMKTEALLRTRASVESCVRTGLLGVFYGNPGYGKTFALRYALSEVKVPILWASFDKATTPREFARTVLARATGVTEPRSATRFDLNARLAEELERPTVLAIDEGDHLNRDCMFSIRWLLDHPSTQVTIVIAGGSATMERIASDPALKSRIHRRVRFKPQSRDWLRRTLPKYHPIYARCDVDLIDEIDERSAHGELRSWAIFTHTAMEEAAALGRGTLDRDVAERTLKLIRDDEI